ncbi:ABC transporter permease [Gryllotalpicola sp.]|uniref:ABC transporter permease n=1 Tax=Gryllotalpicola sp. TaxID=1932787 RepID=UPI002619B03B|nr:ABC transporter permease [Gryllotalpicola sp.]
MLINILVDTLVTGLPLVPVVLGVFIVLQIRQDFDLTVEGSYAFGGGVAGILIVAGVNPVVAMIAAAAAGFAAGMATTALTLFLRLPVLLAGLVMNMALFSITLRVLGLPTLSLAGMQTIFSAVAPAPGRAADLATSAVLGGIVVLMLAAFAVFLKTEVGLALRASGVNERMVRSQGVSDRGMLILSLGMSNALSAFGGALTIQMQGYADVNMGSGVFVLGAGSVLLGMLFLNPGGSQVVRIVLAVLLGGLVYRLILVAALRFGLPAGDLKAVTALTLIIAVAAQGYLAPAVQRYTVRLRERRTPANSSARARIGASHG